MNLLLSCREATRLSSEAMDRPLTWSERMALRFHLVLCALCRRYARQLGFLREALHRHENDAVLSAPARARIEQAIREAT